MQEEKVQRPLDRLAIALSGICVLHCLLTPALIISFPILAASSMADEAFHQALLWLVLPASMLALLLGCFRHKDGTVLVLGLAGLSVIMLTAMWGHELFGEAGERFATVIGGITLTLGHLRNHRLCRRDSCHT
jgi:hypothetical protein